MRTAAGWEEEGSVEFGLLETRSEVVAMPWAPLGKARRMEVVSSQPVGGYFVMAEAMVGGEVRLLGVGW